MIRSMTGILHRFRYILHSLRSSLPMGRGRFQPAFKGLRGFTTCYNRAVRWNRMLTPKAKKKFEILAFWQKHGLQATMDAFHVKRRTLFLWKKKLKEGHGKCTALNERSKTPERRRIRVWPLEVLNEIKNLRMQHPNLGKEKLQILLARFCRRNAQPIPSASTVERFIHGCRRYIITFEDLYSRFAFAWSTTSHASKAAEEFFEFCQMVFPIPFEYVLTDNGSEFKKHFSEKLKELHLTHYHTYPRMPKMNAHCERFNRTIQEEFVDYHAHELFEPQKFNIILMEYLVWFNTERPHY